MTYFGTGCRLPNNSDINLARPVAPCVGCESLSSVLNFSDKEPRVKRRRRLRLFLSVIAERFGGEWPGVLIYRVGWVIRMLKMDGVRILLSSKQHAPSLFVF